jgi:predicted RNase H-like HicB family nuclease
MEIEMVIQEKYGHYIVTFTGLPGCWAYHDTMKGAIQQGYEALEMFQNQSMNNGFACFRACLR